MVIKKLIAPIQNLLLKNGQCVGCGRPLDLGKLIKARKGEGDLIQCQCGRIFVRTEKAYRRASFEEAK